MLVLVFVVSIQLLIRKSPESYVKGISLGLTIFETDGS